MTVELLIIFEKLSTLKRLFNEKLKKLEKETEL